MARTDPMQGGIESTMRSPRSAWCRRGSAATVRAMHSVADRTRGCIAAFFCEIDIWAAAPLGSTTGAVATLTISATAASGAKIISDSPQPRHDQSNTLRVELQNRSDHRDPRATGGTRGSLHGGMPKVLLKMLARAKMAYAMIMPKG